MVRIVRPEATLGKAPLLREVHATAFEADIGRLTVALRDEGVVWIGRDSDPDDEGPGTVPWKFTDEVGRHARTVRWVWEDVPKRTAPVVDGLRRYLDGDPRPFDGLVVAPVGTPFQLRVWEACARIPYGATVTYGELAAMAGRPGAARAVGGAMNRNPVPFVIPCHRVVASDGTLGGYGIGGLPVKRWLLDLERRHRPLVAASTEASP